MRNPVIRTVVTGLVGLIIGIASGAAVSVGLAKPPTVSANLVDPVAKALKQTASVKVTVEGLRLVEASASMEKPKAGEGHLHYQVDKGPVIATTAPALAFHELTPGQHIITVTPVGNDHQPVGTPVVLSVSIP
ncbi:MAG: hypothetical protein ABIX37_00095 [Gammaproteobacteria bacterium]